MVAESTGLPGWLVLASESHSVLSSWWTVIVRLWYWGSPDPASSEWLSQLEELRVRQRSRESLGSAGGQLKDSSLSCRAHPRLDRFGKASHTRPCRNRARNALKCTGFGVSSSFFFIYLLWQSNEVNWFAIGCLAYEKEPLFLSLSLWYHIVRNSSGHFKQLLIYTTGVLHRLFTDPNWVIALFPEVTRLIRANHFN